MAIPYTNRSATFEVPDFALEKLKENKIILTANAMIDDFHSQFENVVTSVECVTQISAKGFRVTFRDATKLEEAMNAGVTICGFPLRFQPVSTHRWVTIRRLPHGIPSEEIAIVLAPYGAIKHIKSEEYKGIYNGDRSVLIDLVHPIPSLVKVKGHNCQAFYRGQPRTCFRCAQSGHESRACPGRVVARQAAVSAAVVDHAADRSDGGVNQVHRDSQVRDGTFIQGTLPVDRSSTVPQLQTVEPASYAQVLTDPVHQDIPPPVGGVAATTSVPSTVSASAIPKDPVLQDIPPPVGGVATTTLGPSTTGEEGTKPQDIVAATKDISLWEGKPVTTTFVPSTKEAETDSEYQSSQEEAVPTVDPPRDPSMDSPLIQYPPNLPVDYRGEADESDISDMDDEPVATPNVFSDTTGTPDIKAPLPRVPKEQPRVQRGSKSRRRPITVAVTETCIPSRIPTRPRLPYGAEKSLNQTAGHRGPVKNTVVDKLQLGKDYPSLRRRRKNKGPSETSGSLDPE